MKAKIRVIVGLTVLLVVLTSMTAAAVEVELWVHQHPPLVEWLESKADQYSQDTENVDVVVRAFPSGDMRTKTFTAIGGGQGPAIFDLFAGDFANTLEKGVIAPVDWQALGYDSKEEFSSKWFESAIQGVKGSDNNYYSLPYLGNPFSLFINKEHFKEAGLDPQKDTPKTWDELIEVANKLTIRENGRLIQKGFDLPFTQGNQWWGFTWLPLVRQFGGSILSEDGKKATLNSDAGVKALQLFYDMVYKHQITEPGITVSDQILPNEDFIQGKTSMWISGTWAIGTFEGKEIMDKYMVVPMPQVDQSNKSSILGGWWWYVNNKKDEDVQKEAWKFLDFITSIPGEQLDKTGLVMPRKKLLDSEAWDNFPYNEAFSQDLAAGEWPYASPLYPQIEQHIANAMESSLINGVDPQKALDKAARLINEELDDYYQN